MRYPATHKAETRERIVNRPPPGVSARGTEGAVIGDLMRDLHLTHGGFYWHFRNKEELFVEAFTHCLQERGRRVVSIIEQAPPKARLKTLVDTYLDFGHCERVAEGCSVAALASELARRSARGPRAAAASALTAHMRLIAGALHKPAPAPANARPTAAAAVLRHGRHADDGAGRGGRGAAADAARQRPAVFSRGGPPLTLFLAH